MALLLAVAGGCKQRCFMTEADFARTTTSTLDHLELNPELSSSSMINPEWLTNDPEGFGSQGPLYFSGGMYRHFARAGPSGAAQLALPWNGTR
jgi:hypothetical protein